MQPTERPDHFNMPIQGGMLEALGINMYTTLGKCLVEFIANAYDSDATYIDITIPVDRIDAARREARALARQQVERGERDRFDVLLEPLEESLVVTIQDDGHGMSWREIQDKYLPLNRKRRAGGDGKESALKSENGHRFVMGRKGLGKLAGFGAAENVEVRSKRRGEDFATTITMRDDVLKVSENVTDVDIPARYEDGLDLEERGTRITLSGLKSDALRERLETLKGVIAEAFFGVRPEDFAIKINGDLVTAEDPDYAMKWPEERGGDDFATHKFTVDDVGEISFRYVVGFRKKNLPARKRGARIYCNNRLAGGPSLFELPTGMHSFHSTDYLECVVEANELDRAGVDFINTNRSQLREDNEVVRRLISEITALMRLSINAHAKFKLDAAEKEIEADSTGKMITTIIDDLPRKTQKAARKLLTTIAAEFGVDSDDFRELAPVVINSMNATEVLADLVHLRTNPATIAVVAEHLKDLREIELDDVLKLFRARRNGITALQTLMERGEEEWNKKGIEAELHGLLKRNPWLIRPELSAYLTSDKDLNKVVSQIAKALGLDDFAPIIDDGKEDETRPDLVFLMSDPSQDGPYVLNVVEFKTPTKALTIEHFRQLEDYMFKVKSWADKHVSHPISSRGYLIGAMPLKETTAQGQLQLLAEYKDQGALSDIRIIGIRELIRESRAIHIEAIKAFEAQEADEEQDGAPVEGG